MKRDITIDVIKGLAIILVVGAHAGVRLNNTICLFHMAVFFIASGYCFKEKYSDSFSGIKSYVLKRTKSLYFVFVGYNAFFLLIRNQLIDIGIYTDNEGFLENVPGNMFGLQNKLSNSEIMSSLKEILLFHGEQQLEGASWFLRAMFSASVFFICWDFLLKKVFGKYLNHARVVSAIVFLFIGNYLGKAGIVWRLNIHSIFLIYFLMIVGRCLKDLNDFFRSMNYKLKFMQLVIMIVFLYYVLIDLTGVVTVNLNSSEVSSLSLFILVSVFGWLLLSSIAHVLQVIPCSFFSDFVSYIGRNSIYVLMLHFLSFKVVVLLQICIYKYPQYALAAFPTMISAGYWSYVYMLVGVLIPIILCFVWKEFSSRIINVFRGGSSNG